MEEPTVNTEENCRLCDEMSEKMFNVFDKNEEGHQIIQLIKENLPILIYRTDPLSKQICDKCLNNLDILSKFKKITNETQQKHKEKLQSNRDKQHCNVQLYLGCDAAMQEVEDEAEELKDACTSTDDLTILCSNCKQTILDASSVNGEIELCTDLHKAIAESLRKNRIRTETDSEKVLRKRKIQPLYHELDDSLCSSLTEFTHNTDGDYDNSQYVFDMQSDLESLDSDQDSQRPVKRRKVENEDSKVGNEDSKVENENSEDGGGLLTIQKLRESVGDSIEEIFRSEPEIRYQPVSLLQLALNTINQTNIPDYAPAHFIEESTHCSCRYCGEKFQNINLLALHEPKHMEIELGEKIDHPVPWSNERLDAHVRNRWLNYFDENGYEEDDIVIDVIRDVSNENLLIPVDNSVSQIKSDTFDGSKVDQIVLVGMKAMVNGIALSDYTKEERKSFYQTMRIQGINKKFCTLCRYSFKDNWAIESHYFSSACYYTCRYCGTRFNKQRHRYDDHIKEHVAQNHEKSDKIFAASKVNNFLPKIIHPGKTRQPQPPPQAPLPIYPLPLQQTPFSTQSSVQPIRVRNVIERKTLQPNLQIKQEPQDDTKTEIITSQSKTGNQAYFCRKCYKVFFKLDEFNIHSKNCDYNQFPSAFRNMQVAMFNHKQNGSVGTVSSAGRPVRNCVKEIGTYKDEAYIPESLLKETIPSSTPQTFVCHICGTPFPTIYSRNSHMRIHKGETSNSQNQKPKVNHYPKFAEVKIKEEPMDTSMEPMVEIHETEQSYSQSIGGGAVSITPISKNPKQKATINPNVMRIVQNNPHLTIAKKSPEKYTGAPTSILNIPGSSQVGPLNNINNMATPDGDKSYKCSSCWEAFANKSHLYFHKKNQCEGSRFPCPFCKKRFGTEAAYSSHIFYSHPE